MKIQTFTCECSFKFFIVKKMRIVIRAVTANDILVMTFGEFREMYADCEHYYKKHICK